MTLLISLPTKQFFPVGTPPGVVAVAPKRGLHRLPLLARAACAGVAALISTTLMAGVVFGISAPEGDASASVVAIAAAHLPARR